jgi:predicted transcriptional regulator with HTH domain
LVINALRKQLRSQHLKLESKFKLYKTKLKPDQLYGSETWNPTKCDESNFKNCLKDSLWIKKRKDCMKETI